MKAEAKKLLTLVCTDRMTGEAVRLAGGSDEYAARLNELRKNLGMKADVLRIRLLLTIDPHAPAVVSSGFLYRLEDPV